MTTNDSEVDAHDADEQDPRLLAGRERIIDRPADDERHHQLCGDEKQDRHQGKADAGPVGPQENPESRHDPAVEGPAEELLVLGHLGSDDSERALLQGCVGQAGDASLVACRS